MLKQEILNTLKYFNIFKQPLTAVQIWRTLILESSGDSALRWQGRKVVSLAQVNQQLKQLTTEGKLGRRWGYYFLHGQDALVDIRLGRHRLAQIKWKIARRLASWLAFVPGVQMLSFSGSLAAANTKPSSDLDIFVVAQEKRIWMTRLGLLLMSQFLGRRRKYFEGSAPDKICLNHYVAENSLAISPDIRNIYTAILYHWLIPVTGEAGFNRFEKANDGWIKSLLMFPARIELPSKLALKRSSFSSWLSRQLNLLAAEPVFDWLEALAEKVQRRIINKHLRERGQAGRIVLSHDELAFHPDTKVPAILNTYYQDLAQQKLL